LVETVLKDPQHAAEIGQKWALQQSRDLLDRGCKTLHYYVLNDVHTVKDIVTKLGV
jgi:5,10-methylenetetrahydrofolate reductase